MTRTISIAAACGLFAATAAADPGTNARETPSRAEVVDAMNAVTPAVDRCGNGWHGLVQTRFVFESSGRVRSVAVNSADVPDPVRRCVEAAAQAARVPPFRRPTFSVSFPFRI